MRKTAQRTALWLFLIALAALRAGDWHPGTSLPVPLLAAEDQVVPAETSIAAERLSVNEARRLATVLHTSLHASLQQVHHRYYREDEGLPLPAAVMRLVFAEVEQQHSVKLRWLAVDGTPMNIDHEAKSDFEHQAVAALKSGKASYESVESGTFRRAAAITLGNHCLKCHVPDRKSTDDRTAGLIISISVHPK